MHSPNDKSELAKLKVLILANWKEDGSWALGRAAKATFARFDLLEPVFFTSGLGRRFNGLSRKLSEFYLPLLAMFKRRQYDVVVSWTSRLGVNYGILNRLCHHRATPWHATIDFHVDLRRNDFSYRFRLWLLRLALPGMDFCFCTSTREEKIYSDRFAAGKFRFLPLHYPTSYFDYPLAARKDYIFAYGNSGRDFPTLIEAVKGIDAPLIILSQAFQPSGETPPNVTLVRHSVPQNELIEYVRCARFVVVPLRHFDFSVGQLALTETMALGCPLVLTSNLATLEYATHNQSALFFNAGDVEGLRSQIRYLVEHPEVATQLGAGARRQAQQYLTRNTDVFFDALGNFAKSRGHRTTR